MLTMLAMLAMAGPAHARTFSLEIGGEDVDVVSNTTLIGGAAMRIEERDKRLVGAVNNDANRCGRAPDPSGQSDGLLWFQVCEGLFNDHDQVDMSNGILDRYTWEVLGKKELIIPANSNKIGGPSVKYADMAKPKHFNRDLPRYALHRVWVVEAELRPATRHTFARRRFYVDEDGWQIVLVDDYDANGGLYPFQEGHYASLRNVLGAGTIPEVIYHTTSGRYFITALANEDKPNDYTFNVEDSFFEAAAAQQRASK
nr:DUF1302 family protein [Panacagrimonas sp.]